MRREDVSLVSYGLLPQDIRQACDPTGANNRAGDRSASIGQWRNRLLNLVVVRVTSESQIMIALRTVDSEVKLVLVVDVVCGARVVVGFGCQIGRGRKAGHQRLGRGIEWNIDDVVGELLSDRHAIHNGGRGRVIDVRYPCEDALTFVHRWNGRYPRDPDKLLDPLIRPEEEKVVGDDRAPDGAAVEVSAILRLCRVNRREVVSSIQVFIAKEFEQASVKSV